MKKQQEQEQVNSSAPKSSLPVHDSKNTSTNREERGKKQEFL